MKTRKLLAVLLTFAMTLSLLPTMAFATGNPSIALVKAAGQYDAISIDDTDDGTDSGTTYKHDVITASGLKTWDPDGVGGKEAAQWASAMVAAPDGATHYIATPVAADNGFHTAATAQTNAMNDLATAETAYNTAYDEYVAAIRAAYAANAAYEAADTLKTETAAALAEAETDYANRATLASQAEAATTVMESLTALNTAAADAATALTEAQTANPSDAEAIAAAQAAKEEADEALATALTEATIGETTGFATYADAEAANTALQTRATHAQTTAWLVAKASADGSAGEALTSAEAAKTAADDTQETKFAAFTTAREAYLAKVTEATADVATLTADGNADGVNVSGYQLWATPAQGAGVAIKWYTVTEASEDVQTEGEAPVDTGVDVNTLAIAANEAEVAYHWLTVNATTKWTISVNDEGMISGVETVTQASDAANLMGVYVLTEDQWTTIQTADIFTKNKSGLDAATTAALLSTKTKISEWEGETPGTDDALAEVKTALGTDFRAGLKLLVVEFKVDGENKVIAYGITEEPLGKKVTVKLADAVNPSENTLVTWAAASPTIVDASGNAACALGETSSALRTYTAGYGTNDAVYYVAPSVTQMRITTTPIAQANAEPNGRKAGVPSTATGDVVAPHDEVAYYTVPIAASGETTVTITYDEKDPWPTLADNQTPIPSTGKTLLNTITSANKTQVEYYKYSGTEWPTGTKTTISDEDTAGFDAGQYRFYLGETDEYYAWKEAEAPSSAVNSAVTEALANDSVAVGPTENGLGGTEVSLDNAQITATDKTAVENAAAANNNGLADGVTEGNVGEYFKLDEVKQADAVKSLTDNGLLTLDGTGALVDANGNTVTAIESSKDIYVEMEVESYTTSEDGKRTYEVNITPMEKTTVTVKTEETPAGTSTVTEKEAELKKMTPFEVTLPNGFFDGTDAEADATKQAGELKVIHLVGGDAAKATQLTVAKNELSVEDGVVSFKVKSMSPFQFTTQVVAKNETTDEDYGSAQAALNDAANGQTVSIKENPGDGLTMPNNKRLTVKNDTDEAVTVQSSKGQKVIEPGETSSISTASGGFVANTDSSANKPTVTTNNNAYGTVTTTSNSVTIKAKDGYKVAKVTVNGKEITLPANGTITGLSASDRVAITYEKVNASTDVLDLYTDVNKNEWYAPALRYVIENGYMTGVGETEFGPNTTISRGMIAKLLANMAGETTDPAAGEKWYDKAVAWAVKNNIFDGTNPEAPALREEFATMLYNYVKTTGKGYTGSWSYTLTNPDADDVQDANREAMQWMVTNKVINGMDAAGTLAPQGTTTRAQFAQMLLNLSNVK